MVPGSGMGRTRLDAGRVNAGRAEVGGVESGRVETGSVESGTAQSGNRGGNLRSNSAVARIILIDDDFLFANLVRHRLAADGHEVEYNEGAFGALTAIRRGRYDLILIDVQMPEIGGPKLVEILRSRGIGSATILLMSSICESELKRTAETFGANGYLCKGWGLDQIAARVREVVRGA
jgi:CheY-like chemotaxis protein